MGTKEDKQVAVVIPNWNGRVLLNECLKSLKHQTQKHQVIVVDNGSTDDSVEFINQTYPGVKVVRLKENRGFAGGVNAGIKQAKKDGASLVVLLNNDAVAESNWLANLVTAAKKQPKVGIIASKIMRSDREHIDSTGEFYTIWGMPFPRGRNEVDSGQFDKQTEIFGASGGATLYRAELFDDIGLFDEDFFLYFEDVDLSFRAQLAGWRVCYEPRAVVYHLVGATSSKHSKLIRYHSTKNFLLLYKKNMPGFLFIKYLPLWLAQYLRMFVSSTLRLHLWTFVRATLATVLLDPKAFKERRQIQKKRKVSVEYIDSILKRSRPKRLPKI